MGPREKGGLSCAVSNMYGVQEGGEVETYSISGNRKKCLIVLISGLIKNSATRSEVGPANVLC
jgi:hypothetical protein